MDWNVIISVQEHGYQTTRQLLHEYGRVMKTEFFNVLVMQVDDINEFLEDMRTLYEMRTPWLNQIGHIMPLTERFTYQSVEEFETRTRAIVAQWLEELAGKHFFVRMHRRGFKGRLSSQEEERFVDEFILQTLAEQGKPARLDFTHPERVIAIETLGQQAGLSLWSDDQLARYPFLKLK